jgi:hypothetical protein
VHLDQMGRELGGLAHQSRPASRLDIRRW